VLWRWTTHLCHGSTLTLKTTIKLRDSLTTIHFFRHDTVPLPAMKDLTANPNDSTAMPPSSVFSPKPFRFLDLPYDIRTMVYRYVPERVKLPLLPDGFRIYYEENAVPTALLQANKSINAELREEMELVRKQEPITLVCPLS
jgi:hypothetical protein